jgi:hypothetical protein
LAFGPDPIEVVGGQREAEQHRGLDEPHDSGEVSGFSPPDKSSHVQPWTATRLPPSLAKSGVPAGAITLPSSSVRRPAAAAELAPWQSRIPVTSPALCSGGPGRKAERWPEQAMVIGGC